MLFGNLEECCCDANQSSGQHDLAPDQYLGKNPIDKVGLPRTSISAKRHSCIALKAMLLLCGFLTFSLVIVGISHCSLSPYKEDADAVLVLGQVLLGSWACTAIAS